MLVAAGQFVSIRGNLQVGTPSHKPWLPYIEASASTHKYWKLLFLHTSCITVCSLLGSTLSADVQRDTEQSGTNTHTLRSVFDSRPQGTHLFESPRDNVAQFILTPFFLLVVAVAQQSNNIYATWGLYVNQLWVYSHTPECSRQERIELMVIHRPSAENIKTTPARGRYRGNT